MAYWLDYSAAKLSGPVIKAAGYTGVVRYIDRPDLLRTKHTDLNEYRSHLAAGLRVMLVMQTTTTASDGGYPVGQDHAKRALAGAEHLGYTDAIFFTNDRPEVPNGVAWRAYLDGAASVLGVGRVGAYGFRNAMDLAVGHASYFWQAGRRSDVAAHTQLWQDNNTQVTVGGITCDRNLIVKDPGEGFMAALSDQEQRTLYNRVLGFLVQRWYVPVLDSTGKPTGRIQLVPEGYPDARPCTALDSADGNYLVGLVDALTKRVVALEDKLTDPAPVDVDYDRIVNGVVAKLSEVRFVPEAA